MAKVLMRMLLPAYLDWLPLERERVEVQEAELVVDSAAVDCWERLSELPVVLSQAL